MTDRRRGPGLRARITLLATSLVAVVSVLLLWLGWLLAGRVVTSVPSLPAGTTVVVGGVRVQAEQLADALAQDARDRLLLAGAVAFVCVLVATALLAWAITGRVLRPLREVTATAHRLSVESLGERIGHQGARDEVAELADTFDAMLDRLQAAFSAQRQFVANASHELRTPLAVIRTELDVTLADADADTTELRRMADVVRAATLRAGELVEALLVLARTDGLGVGVAAPVELPTVVAGAWRSTRSEAERRRITARFSEGPAVVVGDAALLERVAGNLLENAVRHNVDGGWIEVQVVAGPQWTTLAVASSGPVIAAERVAELFEPFRRGGVDRTSHTGTGLGLSIVRAVARAHGGTAAAEPVVGGGLRVTVAFPAV
ncbi:HAMP domain-containing sensor histidine kinase [Actinokineospora sp. NBRC 105648]|uniref:sensor histidine kinase n=1 Tax=Actinokineospora sp. NBRC 105648 TaxID=3032206 RepID=UPI0024A412A0|nr:HAMP domain-containing sensor histidine kinase [Actinokineospora sp. NBRC 105648]GLZ38778.1 two-component sensor histidine kinase [Actinokineospora sp. NBRC 105648]